MFQRFEHLNIKEANTLFDRSIKFGENTGRGIAQLEYASAIGNMMYAMYCTRPNISFVVGKLSRFTSNPSVDHWKAIGRVLGYLKKTINLRLFYSKFPTMLEGYSNVSWITFVNNNKSTSGWTFTLGGGAISWALGGGAILRHQRNKRIFLTPPWNQKTLAATGKEAEWLRNMLLDIELWPQPIPVISMYCNSEATLGRAYSKMYNGKSRHMGLRHDYIRLLIEVDTISIVYVRSNNNLANPLTIAVSQDLVGVTSIEMGLKPFFKENLQ